MARDHTTIKPTHQQTQPAPVDFRDLPDPERYRGLKAGPRLEIEYEDNEAQPLDGSKSLLRTLSPFIIQVEPPLVLGSEPALVEPQTKGTAATGLYGSALKARNGFTNARASLAMTTYVEGNYGPGTPDEIISRSSAARSSGGTRNKSGDGTRKTDDSGKEAASGGGGKIGEPAIADLRTAVDIASQLQSVLATPPLVLLINPESLAVSYTKIQAFQDRTRFGYVFQAWGEEQPSLSITAKCGAFISGGRGVQWASRRDSAAWQNLMTAFQFYRNNGYIYDTVGESNAHLLVGALSIRYDQWIYFGNMQTLSYNLEDAATVHGGVSFEMEFIVSAMVDTASPSFNVGPEQGPNPSPNDTRYSGVENAAFNPSGEFSVFASSGATGGTRAPSTGVSSVLTQEMGTPLDDPDFRPLPQPPPQRGPTSKSRSTQGFQSVQEPVSEEAAIAEPQDVVPFGRRV